MRRHWAHVLAPLIRRPGESYAEALARALDLAAALQDNGYRIERVP